MRQSAVLSKFLVSNSWSKSLGFLGFVSILLGGLTGGAMRAIADEVTGTEPPALKPPVPKTTESVSDPAVRLSIPDQHRTDMPTLAPRQTASGKNNFIDTRNYAPPSEVVVTERRSGGCQTIARGGQLVGGRCVATALAPRQRVAQPLPPVNLTASRRPIRQPDTVAIQPRRQRVFNSVRQYAPTLVASAAPVRLAPPQVIPSAVGTVVALNPPEWNGVKLALAPVTRPVETYPTVESREPATIERATRLAPAQSDRPQRTDLLFPLALPAPITSVFGWRNHPVTGREAMHSGTDLGAPMGTPVLAAYPGVVETADWVGGYGLMVVLRHLDGTQESRYAHLSEITVTPGEQVAQGQAIGRVGSTGMSTGPHLHFEWRHLTAEGWIAVDAGLHLEFALESLMERMQMATTPEPETTAPNPNRS
jgi:murein DD-endopeptidase MepM/ murein hydrolase activator NlpD